LLYSEAASEIPASEKGKSKKYKGKKGKDNFPFLPFAFQKSFIFLLPFHPTLE
jgi:hypothetical protein